MSLKSEILSVKEEWKSFESRINELENQIKQFEENKTNFVHSKCFCGVTQIIKENELRLVTKPQLKNVTTFPEIFEIFSFDKKVFAVSRYGHLSLNWIKNLGWKQYETTPVNELDSARKILKTIETNYCDFEQYVKNDTYANQLKYTQEGIDKVVYDNKLKYAFDYDLLWFDIETLSSNGNFPSVTNPQAMIISIQFTHVKAGYPKTYLYVIERFEKYIQPWENIIYKFFTTSQILAGEFL